MSEPTWVQTKVIQTIHQKQIEAHGGLPGLRAFDLLESALARPKNLYHYSDPKPELAALAASYSYGLVTNHPFVDGNKRTALIVCHLFLRLNQVDFVATQDEKYEVFMQLAQGNLSEQ